MNIITAWNLKGGTGKTTTSFNLAATYAAQDNYIERKRVAKIARRKKWEIENVAKSNGGLHC